MQKGRIWDLPVRLFHLVLIILVSISIYTGLTGGFKEMDYHMLSGYGILGLVIFRVFWGFSGSHHARFINFISIRKLVPYARTLLDRDSPAAKGHNPLGGLSVIAMLISLLVQATTGLFANDDIMLEGPLVHLVSDDTSNLMTEIHEINIVVLYVLLGLHLFAIGFYEIYKRERLILSMITGKKSVPEETGANPGREMVTAVILIGLTAGLVYWIVNYL